MRDRSTIKRLNMYRQKQRWYVALLMKGQGVIQQQTLGCPQRKKEIGVRLIAIEIGNKINIKNTIKYTFQVPQEIQDFFHLSFVCFMCYLHQLVICSCNMQTHTHCIMLVYFFSTSMIYCICFIWSMLLKYPPYPHLLMYSSSQKFGHTFSFF